MPRKNRDYKAEYARRKSLAQSRGYSGPKQEYKARKALSLPRTRHTPSKRAAERFLPSVRDIITPGEAGKIRRENAAWSVGHSRSKGSEWSSSMSDEQARAYHHAFTQKVTGMSRRKAAREKKRRIKEYILEYTDMSEEEWTQKYGSTGE